MISDPSITGISPKGYPIYQGVFELTGTEPQQQIAVNALNELKFPFHELQLPFPPAELGWQDLNTGNFLKEQRGKKIDILAVPMEEKARLHGGEDHGVRKYIYGLMYPGYGIIYIENALVGRPDAAISTIMAEMAHVADYFHPKLQDWKYENGKEVSPKRQAILALQHEDLEHGTHQEHAAEWWEVSDYGAEYFKLPAEAFMQNFSIAYSDRDLQTFFNGFADHIITRAKAQKLLDILEIPRTDQAIIPHTDLKKFVIKRSLIYHKEMHYPKKVKTEVKDTKGLKPCKFCF